MSSPMDEAVSQYHNQPVGGAVQWHPELYTLVSGRFSWSSSSTDVSRPQRRFPSSSHIDLKTGSQSEAAEWYLCFWWGHPWGRFHGEPQTRGFFTTNSYSRTWVQLIFFYCLLNYELLGNRPNPPLLPVRDTSHFHCYKRHSTSDRRTSVTSVSRDGVRSLTSAIQGQCGRQLY